MIEPSRVQPADKLNFPIPSLSFQGKNVVITGAAGGICSVIAAHFLRAGAKVLMVDLFPDKIKLKITELGLQDYPVTVFAADITKINSCKQLSDQVESIFPEGLHVLVNGAGILPREKGSLAADEKRWRETIEVNVLGTRRVTAHLIKALKKASPSSIINIGSIQGFVHLPNSDAYTGSKALIHAYTKSTAQELGRFGIRCNAIAPGAVVTSMTEDALSDSSRREMLLNRTPLGRLSEPRDIALSALVLASEEFSRQITGTIIGVEGGFLTT